jgi:hypothetical protein
MIPPPPHGDRYLYLNEAAVWQKIVTPKAGTRYKLSIYVCCSPEGSSRAADAQRAELRVGLVAKEDWIASERQILEPGDHFAEREYELTIEGSPPPAQTPLYLVLTSTKGEVLIDHLTLTESPSPQ